MARERVGPVKTGSPRASRRDGPPEDSGRRRSADATAADGAIPIAQRSTAARPSASRRASNGTRCSGPSGTTTSRVISELSALFKITAGNAKTENLKINGPLVRVNGAGTADIAAKTLQFKLDTKLVMSLEGQGGPANPVGFGVPVMVEGSWEAPKIYPDMSGILDNPEAAYSKLNELGQGLFGKSSTGGDSLLKGLGDLFKSKGDSGKDAPPPPAADKKNQTQDTPATGSKPQGAPAQDAKAQDTKTEDAKPQDPKSQNGKPQDTKTDDSKPDDTQAKINSILKELFGK